MTVRWKDRNVWLQLKSPPPQYTNHRYWGFASRWMGERQPPYEGFLDRVSGCYVMRFNKIDRRPGSAGGDHA